MLQERANRGYGVDGARESRRWTGSARRRSPVPAETQGGRLVARCRRPNQQYPLFHQEVSAQFV